MSAMVHRLIEQLKHRGLHIAPGTRPGELVLHGPPAERTPDVMAALKAFKPELLKLYCPPPEDAGEPSDDAPTDDSEGERVRPQ